MLTRRTFFAGAAATVMAAPRRALARDRHTLKFVARAELGILDPVWTSALNVRNHGFMIYDTLFAWDSNFKPQYQMLEGHTLENDQRVWRLSLRDGLKWHDGERVLARDCEASIRRWGARDAYGQSLLAVTDELSCPDDKTIVFRLKKPFPYLPDALGKSSGFMPAMMPARLAAMGPDKQVTEIIGSGPFKFKADERIPGVKTVYERFVDYKPREAGTPSRVAGPKRVSFERVEWLVMPDPGTSSAALQAGEVDWIDIPSIDLIPLYRANKGLTLKNLDPNGQVGIWRPNVLHPPFDNPKLRRAILKAVDQSDFMTAVAGEDRSLWRDNMGIFCPGTPLASEAGLPGSGYQPNLEAAKAEVAASGYKGEKAVFMVATDFANLRTYAEVMVDLFQKIGINVDNQSMDLGTLLQRRLKKEPVDKGGWSCFCTSFDGADFVDPAGHQLIRGNGGAAYSGWPTDAKLEHLRDAWLETTDPTEQKSLAKQIQLEALDYVPYVPLGQFFQPTVFRSDIKDVVEGFPIFWNVKRV